MMDLSGPKIRTGNVLAPSNKKRLFRGDLIVLSSVLPPVATNDQNKAIPYPVDHFQICCTVPEILELLQVGTSVYIDDGKIRTRVLDSQYPLPDGNTGILLEVTHAKPKGVKLRPEKGLNFPDTLIPLNPLTDKDLEDLDFVAHHANMIGYSFVQQPKDIELLQEALDQRLEQNSPKPAIIAKIETSIAVSNLSDLIIRAAGKQPFGVMIARGDLAVEI
jgi:pyruvate kinase